MKPIDVAGEWSDWTDDETISIDVKKKRLNPVRLLRTITK